MQCRLVFCRNGGFMFGNLIPHRLFNCKSLTKLKISAEGNYRYTNIILPRSMSLPQLKKLYLCGLSISNVESSKRLFSSCPVLEALEMVDCNIQTDNQRNLVVHSDTLRCLHTRVGVEVFCCKMILWLTLSS